MVNRCSCFRHFYSQFPPISLQIWFQNRRRKDVVGTDKKKQNDSTSSISSNSSKDSEEKADDNESSSEESVSGKDSPKDSDESVVPEVVLKSILSELIRFINDPLKGKKNRKKAKSKQKEKAAIKKGLTTTLLAGGYDMISPPNQITPSAFFEKLKNGFNHSKGSSAFESPRDGPRPVQISGVSSSSDNTVPAHSNSLGDANSIHTSQPNLMNHMSFLPNGFLPNGYSNIPLQSHPANLPVLSNMFPYRPLDATPSASVPSQTTPLSSASASGRTDNGRNIFAGGLGMSSPAHPGRYLGGIFPFPYLAEQPMLLSSARQPDQIYRPSPKYALPKFGEDPYQPLIISSLSNPYYSSASMTSWTNHSLPTPSTYTNL